MKALRLILFIMTFVSGFSAPKVLHLSFHRSCIKEIEYVAEKLGFELETWFMHDLPIEKFDGVTRSSDRYNIDHTKAKEIFDRNKERFETFDLIITSDTAPLCRIFLQNNWKKPLIIWVCNRFDYCDVGSRKCHFPDNEYYKLINSIPSRENVRIVSYTDFEHIYAQKFRNINVWNSTIKPIGSIDKWEMEKSLIPSHIDKSLSFFIPPYHNDTLFIDLSKKLSSLGILNYSGRYAGPMDLKDFKGIVHIPYAWSNLALFENWATGQIYFIPSKRFLLRLCQQENFFWSPPFKKEFLASSEWYLPQHADLFVYFDSWDDLVWKSQNLDLSSMRDRVMAFHQNHEEKMLKKWHSLFRDLLKEL